MSDVYIYGLFDPRDGQIRYIGQTVDMQRRFHEHLFVTSFPWGSQKKNSWIQELKELSLKPEMACLEIVNTAERIHTEKFWIDYFRMLGANLLNYPNVRKSFPNKNRPRPYFYFRSNRQTRQERAAS